MTKQKTSIKSISPSVSLFSQVTQSITFIKQVFAFMYKHLKKYVFTDRNKNHEIELEFKIIGLDQVEDLCFQVIKYEKGIVLENMEDNNWVLKIINSKLIMDLDRAFDNYKINILDTLVRSKSLLAFKT